MQNDKHITRIGFKNGNPLLIVATRVIVLRGKYIMTMTHFKVKLISQLLCIEAVKGHALPAPSIDSGM